MAEALQPCSLPEPPGLCVQSEICCLPQPSHIHNCSPDVLFTYGTQLTWEDTNFLNHSQLVPPCLSPSWLCWFSMSCIHSGVSFTHSLPIHQPQISATLPQAWLQRTLSVVMVDSILISSILGTSAARIHICFKSQKRRLYQACTALRQKQLGKRRQLTAVQCTSQCFEGTWDRENPYLVMQVMESVACMQ